MLGCAGARGGKNSASPFWGVKEPIGGDTQQPHIHLRVGRVSSKSQLRSQFRSQFRPQLILGARSSAGKGSTHAQLTLLPWDNEAARPSPTSHGPQQAPQRPVLTLISAEEIFSFRCSSFPKIILRNTEPWMLFLNAQIPFCSGNPTGEWHKGTAKLQGSWGFR